jgi:GT2 family glycosyltransferase
MSADKSPQVYIGFITFGALTAPYLSLFLDSLAKQTYQDYKIIVYDNTPLKEKEHLNILPNSIDVFSGSENIGFSRAYNKLILAAKQAGAKYFLVINPDTYLDPRALELLVQALEQDDKLASVSPKLLRWDFQNNQLTDVIDSCGLVMRSGLSFFDLGQGIIDQGQYDQAKIIGPTGAAALYNLSALENINENGKYFDENFFMYKEDCDLAYRLFLTGYTAKLVSAAIVYHDRTALGGNLWQRFSNRRQRSQSVRRWSFINQHWLFIKYWSKQNFLSKLMIICKILILGLNALLFEQSLLACYKTILAQRKSLKHYY